MKYFISYLASTGGAGFDSGWVIATSNSPISSKEQLQDIADKIKKAENLKDVVIINWRRMEDAE